MKGRIKKARPKDTTFSHEILAYIVHSTVCKLWVKAVNTRITCN